MVVVYCDVISSIRRQVYTCTCIYMYMAIIQVLVHVYYIHVLMRDERSKQSQTNNKAKQHSTPKAVTVHLYIVLTLYIA